MKFGSQVPASCGQISKKKLTAVPSIYKEVHALGDLLGQPDYGGNDYEDGLQNATVLCKELTEEEDEEGNKIVCGDHEEGAGRQT